jgi:hypothetical protein
MSQSEVLDIIDKEGIATLQSISCKLSISITAVGKALSSLSKYDEIVAITLKNYKVYISNGIYNYISNIK